MTRADTRLSTPPTNTPISQIRSDAPSRRRFLAQAAGGAALGMALPLPAGASERVPDPILAAIEAHKAARAAFEAAVRRHSALERELPAEKRQSSVTVWEEDIVTTDDARWIDCERTVIRCMDAETDAACTLVNILPTTMAGVVALLRYAVDADTDGEGWPPVIETDDGKARSWRHFLLANLADILPELEAGRAV